MKCPYCNSEQSYCIDSRPVQNERRRKYRCGICGNTFKTTERVVREELESNKSKTERKE